ncbi:glycosyltransferase family protein [Schaalia suimastitidis]|uniref:glycosyltransferase family protein n=1 Tax=Schaalia suimastitidis TaxID=121163 RepID=UPI000402D4C9|nr:glycosyltransferase [Schaalia suimastitidis]
MFTEKTRVVLYSHDSQGLGHLRRNLALAHHLANELPRMGGKELTGLLVTGIVPPAGSTLPEGFDWLILPGISKASGSYQARNLGEDLPTVLSIRSAMIEAALLSFEPDMVIVDRHIYGVGKELKKPLHCLRSYLPHSRIILGLREVLDSPQRCAREWEKLGAGTELRDIIDEVWIYGDKKVHDTTATGEIPWYLHTKAVFTGYIAKRHHLGDHGLDSKRPYIVTTAGGGEDGYHILEQAVQIDVPHGYDHIVVTGPQLDRDSRKRLHTIARTGTQIIPSLPGLGKVIDEASAVIAMGGYNTVSEILATTTPALIVPREKPRQEQLIRAQALEKHGAVEVLRAPHAHADSLTAWIHSAVGRTVSRSNIARDGLEHMCHRAATLLKDTAASTMKEVL